MASPKSTPRFAISATFDARAWADEDLYRKDAGGLTGDPVSMPDWGDGAGVFPCAVAFLNGYGVPPSRGLSNDFQQLWEIRGGDPKDVNIMLTVGDRLSITIADALAQIEIGADFDNGPFGYSEDVDLGPATGPSGALTAPDDWPRVRVMRPGVARPPRLTISHDLGGADITIPRYAAVEQSITHMLRPRGEVEDADDVYLGICLEDLDNAVYDPLVGTVGNRTRWGITEDGYVYHCVPRSDPYKDIKWLSVSFRDRLGFTGEEVAVVSGGNNDLDVWVTVATHPLPGFITPKRKIRRMDETIHEYGAELTLLDGSSAVTRLAQHFGWSLSMTLLGHDLRASVGFDEVRHWYRSVRPYLWRGDRLTYFAEWGEFRRGRRVVDGEDYTTLYTPDRDGYRGRYVAKLNADGTGERQVAEYEANTSNNRIRHQLDLSITVLGEE